MMPVFKRFFAMIIACSVIAGMCALPSYADDAEFNVKCTVENGVYDIAGSGKADFINVLIMPAEESVNDITAEKLTQTDHIAFSVENGSSGFEKSFTLPQDFPDWEYKSVVWDGAEAHELYFMSGSETFKNGVLSKKIKDGMLEEAVVRYGEEYGINVEEFKNLKESVRLAVEAELAGTEITDFASQYNESVLNASFEQLESYEEVYDVLVMLGTDLTDYNSLSNSEQQSVLLRLLRNLPDTPEQLRTLAEKYISEARQNTGTGNTTGSSSSGNGSTSLGPSAGSSIITTNGQTSKPDPTSTPTVQPLSDISGHWAEDVIRELAEKGIVSGSDDGNFYPDKNITRAEFSKMLAEAIGGSSYNGQQQFLDVDSSAWYFGYVMSLCEQGIILGYEDGTFRPDDNITRQDMAVMIYRVLEQRGIELENEAGFSDESEISDYALDAVLHLSGAGIISGFDGKFRPADLLTRAEAAAIALRTCNSIENSAVSQSAEADGTNSETETEETAASQSAIVTSELTRKEARIAEAEQLIEKLLVRKLRGVTRAGFISDVYELTNRIVISADEQYFVDLPLSREETASVQAAADAGFIQRGDEFYPDEAITGYDAVHVMVCALGYKEYAEAAGGGITGYMNAAGRAELLEGVSADLNGALDEDSAKLMLLNMLQSRPVTAAGSNGGGIEYVTDEKTLLEKVFGIYVNTGIVEQTTLNSLTKTGISKEKSIIVGGERYTAVADDEADYMSYLGCRVNVYHTEENELFMLAKTEKNKTVTFPVSGAHMQDNLTVLYEDENSHRSYRYKLDDSYYYLYNGALSSGTLERVLSETDDGTVELLDNDNDGNYDVVTVKKPEYVVVDSISRSNRLIYDKNSSENTIDLSDEEIVLTVEGRNGQQLRFLDISAGETYEVYMTEDRMLVSLKLMSDILSGSAERIGQGEITINGKAYNTTGYFDKYYSGILDLGNNYSFSVSSEGKLIAFQGSGGNMRLGYIVFAGWDEGGEGESMVIKLFTQDGGFETYTIGNKLIADGSSADINALYGRLLTGSEVNDQLVYYRTDDGGKITALDFAEQSSGDGPGAKREEGNSLIEYSFSQSSFYYKDTVELMYPSFNVSGTMVFVVPNDIQDRDTFRITDSSFFTDGQSYSNLRVYNLSENGTAEVVVVRSETSIPSISKYTASFVVEKVQEEVNVSEEGDIMMRVYGWEDQKYKLYFIDNDISLYKASGEVLGFGDIIRFYAEGDIIKYMICDFDANEAVFSRNNTAEAAQINGGNQDVMYQFGEVYSLGNGYIYLGGGDDGRDMSVSAIRNFAADTENIAIIDMQNHTVRTGTLSDIKTYKNYGMGDIVFIRQRNLFTMAIYVYVQ